MLVEQAIFSSARTARAEGYQIVAASGGVSPEDRQALAAWCPSHDALLDEHDPAAKSINFHPLPSGAYCIARTTPAGAEFSGRGGVQVKTHCLIVGEELFARFSNDPFAVLRAALAGGRMEYGARPPEELPAFALVGRAKPCSEELLAAATRRWGAVRMAAFVDGMLAHDALGIFGNPAIEVVLEAALGCLPVECRPEFSFSTGLRFSPRRPFRVVAAANRHDAERLARAHAVAPLEWDALAGCETLTTGWAELVLRLLNANDLPELADCLAEKRPGLELDSLDCVADGLLRQYPRPTPAISATGKARRALEAASLHVERAAAESAAGEATEMCELHHPPEVVAQLEQLDDLVYSAISGNTSAMDELQQLWPQLLKELGNEAVETSRAHYLDFALRAWHECRAGARDAAHAITALDVLCLLMEP